MSTPENAAPAVKDPYADIKVIILRMVDEAYDKGYRRATMQTVDHIKKLSEEDQEKFIPLLNVLEEALLKVTPPTTAAHTLK